MILLFHKVGTSSWFLPTFYFPNIPWLQYFKTNSLREEVSGTEGEKDRGRGRGRKPRRRRWGREEDGEKKWEERRTGERSEKGKRGERARERECWQSKWVTTNGTEFGKECENNATLVREKRNEWVRKKVSDWKEMSKITNRIKDSELIKADIFLHTYKNTDT